MKKRQQKSSINYNTNWGSSVPTNYKEYWKYLDNVLKHNPAKREISNEKAREYKRTMKALSLNT